MINIESFFFNIITGPTLEPPLPRRKKCPELAYRTHTFAPTDKIGIDAVDSNVVADKIRVSFFPFLLVKLSTFFLKFVYLGCHINTANKPIN